MRIAYADPPYLGYAYYYEEHKEVDHAELLDNLAAYDGWALSCYSGSLRKILALPNLPDDIRIGSWVKTFVPYKTQNPVYAWEPVIFHGGRRLKGDKVLDWVQCSVTLKTGMIGSKPEKFCFWMFLMLGARRGDELVDMFPGSGAVTKAWDKYQRQTRLVLEET